ncbi:MAG TPA: PIG-L deacetylase family protein [Terriglobia bacterium]|nr:PIG-L deacetylase family protein [Terriglobia bacterium]
MERITRRKLLAAAGPAAGALLGLPLAGAVQGPAETEHKLSVVVVGAHPDDPESSCGGTMALYASLGHPVTAVYLTRGEAGINGKTPAEAAAIRTSEAERACAILGVHPVFAGQIDGATEVSTARYDDFRRVLEAAKPDVVLAPWPVDSHRDHRAASLLVYDAWLRGGRSFQLYYSEVDLGDQTQDFHPTHYVDITSMVEKKRQACFAHISQDPPSFYNDYHEPMQKFRGMESGCASAEAFIRHPQNLPHRLEA